MKTIGILGGMSWVSSLHYYKWLNELAQDRLGPINNSKILLSSVDWQKIQTHQKNGEWDAAGDYLADEARKLESIGAELMLIGTNTMHKVADRVQAAINIPLLHIADATATRIKTKGLDSIALLGTSYTMEQDFYKGRLENQGITVLTPKRQEDRNRINAIIFDELCQNVQKPKSKAEYIRIANDMFDHGAQGLIMGCTEITTLIGPGDFTQPVFDTTRIHVEEAFEMALEEE
ncbi:MAG: aspartate/glutamate racemase family protein [Rhodospirillales bacterium]|nr:aspartate/glutamate racemase family protein [Alphaproteobacteria bacterium]MCB9981155.1 aspartate/glutamate racemase family protein [Rhodospirillales bacterium]